MATNVQGTRPATHPDGQTVVETTPTPVTNANGIGSVAVYDTDGDRVADTPVRPTASLRSDPIPATTGSSGSGISWIIGAIVLIVLAYFLLQLLF
jgi:hypothetical protein